MTRITENHIELLAKQRLESLGYHFRGRNKVKVEHGHSMDRVFFPEDDTFTTMIW
jgi:hypothetical protein